MSEKMRYPIVYIRGYAMTVSERNDTAADPFCGFNVGSTMYRAANSTSKVASKFVFESPLVRLASEYKYQHAYQNGYDIMDPDWEPPRDDNGKPIPGLPASSIVIYRYYDDGSSIFGDGKARNIRDYAIGLSKLIKRLKELVIQHVPTDGTARLTEDTFGFHLVAHSMGGLVARAFLQGQDLDGNTLDVENIKGKVKKFFTFATPHNGIDVLGMNVPSWLTPDQANTFSRVEMQKYLNTSHLSRYLTDPSRVDVISTDVINADNIFCMIGSNRGDYEVGQGVVRAFVGNGSDGLVRIDNASVWGIDTKAQASDDPVKQVATAYAFRSHSGFFGIVNSEEAYQNLARFLFGDVRVDIYLEIASVTLPADLQKEDPAKIEALYQFELCASPKGKRWFLTRRQSIEDSPAVRTHAQLTGTDAKEKRIYLSSVFLSKRARVDVESDTLSYSMTFAAKVPDYQLNKKFWPNEHYEGANLFSDSAIIRVSPPAPDVADQKSWIVDYGWSKAQRQWVPIDLTDAKPDEVVLDFDTQSAPGIKGALHLVVRKWS
jgi:pimeloyl-ACP methyl ester carboxylesterase